MSLKPILFFIIDESRQNRIESITICTYRFNVKINLILENCICILIKRKKKKQNYTLSILLVQYYNATNSYYTVVILKTNTGLRISIFFDCLLWL